MPYVPVLVDDDEVVSDSRRILQYLDWRYGEESGEDPEGPPEQGSTMACDE